MAPQATAELLEELQRSRRMLAEAQQLAKIGSWEWDVPLNAVTWSDELFRIYGYEPQTFEPTYETFLAHVHSEDREDVDARNHRAFADHQPFEDVKRVIKADGTEILMQTRGEVLTAPDGTVMRMLGVCEDVTDRIRAEEAQALLASVVRSSNDAIYTVREGVITSWNPAAELLLGFAEEDAVGSPAARLVPPAHAEEDARRMRAADPEPWETARLRADGTAAPVSLVLSRVGDGISVVARDETERRRYEQQLRHLADHDPLTGLHNRKRFEEELERAVGFAVRYGTGGAVFVLDLDNFKRVNDSLGHGAGDELIRSIATLLRGRLRATDVLARLGGDELAVLIPHADAAEARSVSRGIISAIRGHETRVGDHPIRVTTSLGGVLLDEASASGEAVLACADVALYQAKDAGRDRAILLSSADVRRSVPGTDWERRVEEALRNDHFALYLQPILSLSENTVTRYEALLRMTDDGVVLPGEFLPAAERSGLIHDVDRWVVAHAMRLLAALDGPELEVNLSARSLDDPDLVGLIEDELARSGADPRRLVFEITETATIANMEDARRFAEAMSVFGCRFAIDDFGAGFGSFSYLKHLPAAFLKIDGDFVQTPRSRTDELVIEAIVGMARGLGKQTIAEFVGDDDTIAMLRRMGVDYAQGFHVGRPVPASEVLAR